MIRREQVSVICPACRQRVEAIASDVKVTGYCAVARQYVEFLAKTQLIAVQQYRQAMSNTIKKEWEDPDYRTKVIDGIKRRRQDTKYQSKMRDAAMKRQTS